MAFLEKKKKNRDQLCCSCPPSGYKASLFRCQHCFPHSGEEADKKALHITCSNSQLGRHRQVSSYPVLQSEQEEMLEIEPWLLKCTLQKR